MKAVFGYQPSKILSFSVVGPFPDGRGYRVDVEAERIRNVNQYGVTTWLDSLEKAEAARRQLIRLLVDAQPTQVVRWKGSAFICEDR